jgi:Fur family ferric uptake transcriptional regulator
VGRTTVYRTLKLLREAGLASELQVGGETRFERDYKREHHDHLICEECGEIIEFSSPEIERLQEEIARKLGFVIKGHRHQIYGLCQRPSCASRPERRKTRG